MDTSPKRDKDAVAFKMPFCQKAPIYSEQRAGDAG